MIQVAMLQGTGNNESAWARIISLRGRVVLYCVDGESHQEVWEGGSLVSSTPWEPVNRWNILLNDTLWLLRLVRVTNGFHRKYGKFDLVIGTSSLRGFAALLMRQAGKSRRMVSLIQDHYPVKGTILQRVWRTYHHAITGFSARRADEVWRVSGRIPVEHLNPRHFTIPIYIDDNTADPDNRKDIVYVGGPIEDHCLQWLFDICRKHLIRLHVVGSSKYLDTIRHQAPPEAIFYGSIYDQAKLAEIMRRCFCGYAVYRDTSENNYAWYGVPSKIYGYLANNLPVVTTDICEWSHYVADNDLGLLIEPNRENVEAAILGLRPNFLKYYESIGRFRRKWNTGVEEFLSVRMDSLLIP